MLRPNSVWTLMRKHTKRQIEDEAVKTLYDFLSSSVEKFIKNIVDECEVLLLYNGTKNQRISLDVIKGVIKRKHNSSLPAMAGNRGDIKRKKEKSLHLPNEVKKTYE